MSILPLSNGLYQTITRHCLNVLLYCSLYFPTIAYNSYIILYISKSITVKIYTWLYGKLENSIWIVLMTLHFTNFQHTLRDTEKVLCVTTFNRVGIVLFFKKFQKEKKNKYIYFHTGYVFMTGHICLDVKWMVVLFRFSLCFVNQLIFLIGPKSKILRLMKQCAIFRLYQISNAQ